MQRQQMYRTARRLQSTRLVMYLAGLRRIFPERRLKKVPLLNLPSGSSLANRKCSLVVQELIKAAATEESGR